MGDEVAAGRASVQRAGQTGSEDGVRERQAFADWLAEGGGVGGGNSEDDGNGEEPCRMIPAGAGWENQISKSKGQNDK